MCRSPAISPSQGKFPRADGCCRWAAFARAAAKAGLEGLILPAANAAEALDAPIRACPVSNIKEVFALAMGEAALDAPSQEMAEPFFSQARVPAQKKIAAHAAEEGSAPSEGKEDGVPI